MRLVLLDVAVLCGAVVMGRDLYYGLLVIWLILGSELSTIGLCIPLPP